MSHFTFFFNRLNFINGQIRPLNNKYEGLSDQTKKDKVTKRP
jgi:hypothetical protein